MLQIIETTDEEKVKMYGKLPKAKLVQMLIQANKIIDTIKPIAYTTKNYCECHSSTVNVINGKFICAVCHKPLLMSY